MNASQAPDPGQRPAAATATGLSPEAERKRQSVQKMFAAITPAYDRLNHLLSLNLDRRWRRRAAGMFGADVKLVLDVAAGTGDLSLAWLRGRPLARVLASDFVAEMCAVGDGKLRGGSGYLGFARADALSLPFPDGSFDGAMAAFGVRNFADLEAGIGEMVRVIRPGGELMVLEFFPQRNAIMEGLFRFYFHRFLPLVGRWISGHDDAYDYLPRSVEGFATREQFAELLERNGCGRIRRIQFSGGIATAFHAKKSGAGAGRRD